MAHDAAASKVRFRPEASVPQYRRRTFITAEDWAQVNYVQTDCRFWPSRLVPVSFSTTTSRLGGSNIGSRRDLTAGGLLWLVLLPRVGGALTAAPASARKYLVSKYLVKRVARSSDAKWPEAS
jgi:hypothetical protein